MVAKNDDVLKINTKIAEGRWVNYNKKVRFKIRAHPIDNLMVLLERSKDAQVLGKMMCEYCVMDWEGIEDGDTNEPYLCTDDNKKWFFNYYVDFINFISIEVNNLKNVEPHIEKKTSKQ